MYNSKNDFLPVNFKYYFHYIDKVHYHFAKYSQRNFFLPICNSKHRQKSLVYQGSKLWTELPNDLKDQSHRGRFQVDLRDFLLKEQLIKQSINRFHANIIFICFRSILTITLFLR